MDNVVEKLDESTQKRALEELHEDIKNRDGAIETFRDWIKQQPWLKSPIDSRFLIRFLRTKKYSQLEARKSLESYWRARSAVPEWFLNRDPSDENILKVISKGVITLMPKTDGLGRRYILIRFGALDAGSIKTELGGVDAIYRAFFTVIDWFTMDPRVQINGVVGIMDLTGYSLQHKMLLHSSENLKKYLGIVQSNTMRVKSMNIYNMPPVFEAVFVLIKTLLKPKLRDRVKTHGRTLVSLYNNIDMDVLPDEYLPDDHTGTSSGSLDDIIGQMKEQLVKPEVVEYIRNISKSEYGVDSKLKPSETDVPSESFRKLNVD
ncbi:hypothetical protein ACF0H5_023201 [Mactra antiquata]